jgi:hypothetical protein
MMRKANDPPVAAISPNEVKPPQASLGCECGAEKQRPQRACRE